MSLDFDVMRDQWIPVRAVDGTRRVVGLRDAIVDAAVLEALDTPKPLEAIATLRILLAVVHRIVDGPKSPEARAELYAKGSFDQKAVNNYYERWKDRFGLFDSNRPFLQVPGLSVVDKNGQDSPLRIESIIPESSPNKTLFNHHADERPAELSPAEAARALIVFLYYGLPGLAKKNINIVSIGYQQSFSSAPLLQGIATILVGPTLFDTLCLNLLEYDGTVPIAGVAPNADAPPWEREPVLRSGAYTPLGYLDYLVPLSRHVRLLPEVVDGRTIVRSVHYTQGLGYDCSKLEPMFHKTVNRKNGELYIPKASEEKALWRDSGALFAFARLSNEAQKGERPKSFEQFSRLRRTFERRHGSQALRCESYALVNDKANPILWIRDSMAFPESALIDGNVARLIGDSVDLADAGRDCLYKAVWAFAAESLGKDPAKTDISRLVKATGAETQYWSALEPSFKRYLESADHDNAIIVWKRFVIETARRSFQTCVEARSASGYRFFAALASGKSVLESGLTKSIPIGEGEKNECRGVD